MIYIDISPAVHSRAGLGRYSEELANALINEKSNNLSLFYAIGRDGKLPSSLSGVPQRRIKLGYKPWRMAVLLGQLGHLSFKKLIPGVQLFHSTEHLLMPLRSTPAVLTVHDLIFKLYPDYHKQLNYYYLNLAMPLFCQKAAAIIAVSEATKRDIVTHYQINPDKIHVVYEAAASHFKPPEPKEIGRVRKEYELPEMFLLHLSTIEPRKNLNRLLEALKILLADFPDLKLVLAGSKGWLFDEFFEQIKRDKLEQVVRPLGWIPDKDLPGIIAAASLAVQPSLYEGFGLPILEHMASGQVVAASNSSSHPEVGGEAVAYFDPHKTDQMAEVIGRLLADKEEYKQRRQLGRIQANKFSWQRAAQQTIRIYDSLLY